METNEKITNSTYGRALELNLPSDIKEIVTKNYEDEKRHLTYIQNTLKLLAVKE